MAKRVLYCATCRKQTKHSYLGTSRYSEPVRGSDVPKVVVEGLYECDECATCCTGPVQ